jgi:transcription elongation factor Elf1
MPGKSGQNTAGAAHCILVTFSIGIWSEWIWQRRAKREPTHYSTSAVAVPGLIVWMHDMLRLNPIPFDGLRSHRRQASVFGLRRESERLMQYLMRKWNCTNCNLSNLTEVALDGTALCEYCVVKVQIQPSRARGGETPDQLSAFIQANAGSQQGEWAILADSSASRRPGSETGR